MSNISAVDESNFLSECEKNNFPVDDETLLCLRKYAGLLLYHNKVVNLISRKDEENIWPDHILHCTRLLFHKKFPTGARVLDLGTGGGLPGIVFAIFNPSLRITLLDATRKKIDAVQSIVDDLGLLNVTTVWGRAEEVGRKSGYAGEMDIIVARAVGPLNRLVKWSILFLRHAEGVRQTDPAILPVPSLVAFKGGDMHKELESIRNLKNHASVDVIELDPEEEKKVVILKFY
jgi:16S rRNA (guanine527-N7)-methyltransferase